MGMRAVLVVSQPSEEKLLKLQGLGLVWQHIRERYDLNSVPTHEIVWLVGSKLKFDHGIWRSFSLNIIMNDGKLYDAGWPHVVIWNQCPILVCLPDPMLDGFNDLLPKFVEDVKNAATTLLDSGSFG